MTQTVAPTDELLAMRLQRAVGRLNLLSARERETLELIGIGWSNRAICDHLFIAPKTVESHVRSVFCKLGFDDRPDVHRRVLAARVTLLAATQRRHAQKLDRPAA